MNPGGISEEAGKTARSFFDVLKDQPLSLALVVMNFLLVVFMFYSGARQIAQRQETTSAIIEWQKATDKLMASCVSKDIMELVLNALQHTMPVQPVPIQPPRPVVPVVPVPQQEDKPAPRGQVDPTRYAMILICKD